MTVCLSTLVTLYFMEHYDSARSYRQGYLRRSSHEQNTGPSKQEAIAFSYNYTTTNDTANDLRLLHGLLKPTKKNTLYKTENGGRGNQMPFPDERFGTVVNGGGGVTGADGTNNLGPNLNWNNVEFVLLYISKLQQYINEVQKTSKGKLQSLINGSANSGPAPPPPQPPSDSVDGDANGNGEDCAIDCDSVETAAADETNLAASGAEGDSMPKFLNNILLNVSNQSSTESPPSPLAENNPVSDSRFIYSSSGDNYFPPRFQLKSKKKNPTSDKSAIDFEAATAPEGPSQETVAQLGDLAIVVGPKNEDLKDARQKRPSPPQEPDIENLINSNK